MNADEIENRVTYHPPSAKGAFTHEALSRCFIEVMRLVDLNVPDSREKSLAMTKLEEAKFWSSAGVARNEETR